MTSGDTAHRLNPRARGWLHFLWRKATTPDDWSEDGEPHPWWDRYSTPPMLNFPRFDLSESGYAVAVMADMTPAWREVYDRILGELVERHLTYWAAIDWLSQFGPDPKRGDYPDAWKGFLIPEHLFGEYDTPGWVANGIEPWGLQPDPIGAEGNLFFKGWLNLLMALHRYVGGDRKWDAPFQVAGVDRARFEWTQPRLADRLVDQWRQHPEGPHCENTKVWPFCLSAAGLGLQLYDAVSGKGTHGAYETWLDFAKANYFGFDKSGALDWVTFYYDPLLDEQLRHGPGDGLPISFYVMPQDPDFAEFLYHAAVTRMGWNDPAKELRAPADPRFLSLGLVAAREWGDDVTATRLSDHVEANYDPRYFGDQEEMFGWWFQFDEAWPRGQISALLMMSEVGGKGAWRRLFREPNLWKLDAPSVEGVEFPALGIAQARNDVAAGTLIVETYAADPSKKGAATSFEAFNLPSANDIAVRCDGASYDKWRVTGPGRIAIDLSIGAHLFEIETGYRRGVTVPNSESTGENASSTSGGQTHAPAALTPNLFPASMPVTACPCCMTG